MKTKIFSYNDLLSVTRDALLDWAEAHYGTISDIPDTIWVYGVPRGGQTLAGLLSTPFYATWDITRADVILDDIIDSGATLERHAEISPLPFVAPIDKRDPDSPYADKWIVFPWEQSNGENGPHDAVRRILQYIGVDPDEPGVRDTPDRVLRAWKELTAGYDMDPAKILERQFDESADEIVMLKGIRFSSTCEHHLLPFTGTATVGYLPGEKVVGLSKLARIVECYARRLQVQERMTNQIARDVLNHLDAKGAGVIIEAHHSCMGCRGAKQPDATMVTSAMLGFFRENASARAEFLRLAHGGK